MTQFAITALSDSGLFLPFALLRCVRGRAGLTLLIHETGVSKRSPVRNVAFKPAAQALSLEVVCFTSYSTDVDLSGDFVLQLGSVEL
jgi:hypothetical protein